MDEQEVDRIYRDCTRFLTHHYRKTPQQVLSELAEFTAPELRADHYGQGEVISGFEQQIAELLGKDAAVFMPSGTMCQQIALRIWSERHGGNLIQLFPYVLSARKGLQDHLGRIGQYCDKAGEVAATLAQFPQIEVMPNPPQTNMMHLFLRGDREKLASAALAIAQETRTWLFSSLAPTGIPGYAGFELTIGEAALDLSNEEIASLFETLFARSEEQ